MSRVIGKGYDFEDVLIIPKYNKVLSRRNVSFETSVTRNHRIKIPFISANMDTITELDMATEMGSLGGLGVIHRFMPDYAQENIVKSIKKSNLLSAGAIGVKDYKERSKKLVEAGIDILVLDIAHGHSKYAGKALDYLKETYPSIDVIAGNVATRDAAEYFISKEADAIKVGIGPGEVCTTRINTGVGVPQLTAIMEVYEATHGRVPLIADGGIKSPGDVVKAIGAGANSVMCGYIFAGCDETPTELYKCTGPGCRCEDIESYHKRVYRGSASKGVKEETAYIEGREITVEPKGPVKNVINNYLDGLASGMTYIGANSLDKLVGKADFILK